MRTKAVWLFLGIWCALFLVRFGALGHYTWHNEQECHVGGIAWELTHHGLRFPTRVFAPNEYDGGSFLNGVFAAIVFALSGGPHFLALKLITHTFAALGVFATFTLLKRALGELELAERIGYAVFAIAILLAPRVVTGQSMYAVGNHTEASALCLVLLAGFAARLERPNRARIALIWAIGALFLSWNKGALLAILLMAAGELVAYLRSERASGDRRRLSWAATGFLLGSLPELLEAGRAGGAGWNRIGDKLGRGLSRFPNAVESSLYGLADRRSWTLLVWGSVLVWASVRAVRLQKPALSLAVGFVWLHLFALAFMAQGGFDQYAIYSYPALAVLLALAVSAVAHKLEQQRGATLANVGASFAVAGVAALTWPNSWNHRPVGTLSHLWNAREASVCSWRFAEGFGREYPDAVRWGPELEAYEIQECRKLDGVQHLDCIGGISREMHWRGRARVEHRPPPELDRDEASAYAFGYGTHRGGRLEACLDFDDAELVRTCQGAVRLDCLLWADVFTVGLTQAPIGKPGCDLPAPKMGAFWAHVQAEITSRAPGPRPRIPSELVSVEKDDFSGCERVFAECY